jgi:isopentenyl-diphosphate delta-isomerase
MDEVILVNEDDEQVGVMEKMEAHQKALLHRAFSVFIFNEKKEMLLQQRALSKYHSGGLWTNLVSCQKKIERRAWFRYRHTQSIRFRL